MQDRLGNQYEPVFACAKENADCPLETELPLSWFPMPDKVEFAKYFSKYMLIFEGIKNRDIAFSPLIKKPVETKDSLEPDAHIDLICGMMRYCERDYAHVPDVKAAFPPPAVLGNVMYPADIFSDSPGSPKSWTDSERVSGATGPATWSCR